MFGLTVYRDYVCSHGLPSAAAFVVALLNFEILKLFLSVSLSVWYRRQTLDYCTRFYIYTWFYSFGVDVFHLGISPSAWIFDNGW